MSCEVWKVGKPSPSCHTSARSDPEDEDHCNCRRFNSPIKQFPELVLSQFQQYFIWLGALWRWCPSVWCWGSTMRRYESEDEWAPTWTWANIVWRFWGSALIAPGTFPPSTSMCGSGESTCSRLLVPSMPEAWHGLQTYVNTSIIKLQYRHRCLSLSAVFSALIWSRHPPLRPDSSRFFAAPLSRNILKDSVSSRAYLWHVEKAWPSCKDTVYLWRYLDKMVSDFALSLPIQTGSLQRTTEYIGEENECQRRYVCWDKVDSSAMVWWLVNSLVSLDVALNGVNSFRLMECVCTATEKVQTSVTYISKNDL